MYNCLDFLCSPDELSLLGNYKYKRPSLFLVIYFILKYVLSDVNIPITALFWLLLAGYIFTHTFTFNLSAPLYLKWDSCTQYRPGSYFLKSNLSCTTLYVIRENKNFLNGIPLPTYQNGQNPEHWQYQMLAKMRVNRNSPSLLVGMQNCTVTFEESLTVPYKINLLWPHDSWYLPKWVENVCHTQERL